MNYTSPDNIDHEDTPEDILNGALIFCRTISILLEDNTGIIVGLHGDMRSPTNKKNATKVVVFKSDNMIHIDDISDEEEILIEGQLITIQKGD